MALTPPVSELFVQPGLSLGEALVPLDRTGLGFLLVVDDDGRLVGVLTDGDIRRAMLRGTTTVDAVAQAMQTAFVTLPADADNEQIVKTLSERIFFVPLVDAAGRPVDYATHGRHRRVPVAEPLLDGNEAEYLLECVRSGWISSQGPFVKRFEDAVAEFHGTPHALAVSNGTAALHLALAALGIGPGDEVIVPDFTFAATASSVRHAAATPVLVDVSEETWTLDLAATERAITPKTRAIIPVHLYGHPCEMAPLMALAQAHGLFVIEDVAEAFGAYANGQLVGTFGDAACFSFYGNKTLTTGEGGMLLTRDAAVAERAALLRDHGMSKERRYWHVEVGFNYRLTNLQAAVGVAQMERVDDVLARKQALAARYGEALAQIAGLELPPSAPWAAPVCWLYTVRVLETLGLARDDLAARLLQRGIETRPTFLPLHRMPAFAEFTGERNFPVTDMLAASGLSLPSAATLDERDVDAVVDAIQGIAEVRRLRVSAGPSST